ncbi:hypothetical protein ACFOQM_16970 [Paenibacillus sp. GCM10012307]|uniref:hypothetical protein n=1 Tax=Paenibacillus sp. GCM10012307 TaxID=3317343 RepID=UPI0036179761
MEENERNSGFVTRRGDGAACCICRHEPLHLPVLPQSGEWRVGRCPGALTKLVKKGIIYCNDFNSLSTLKGNNAAMPSESGTCTSCEVLQDVAVICRPGVALARLKYAN